MARRSEGQNPKAREAPSFQINSAPPGPPWAPWQSPGLASKKPQDLGHSTNRCLSVGGHICIGNLWRASLKLAARIAGEPKEGPGGSEG
jgi:hypothetical protein